ncbi:ABC transporter permease [Mycobacteroides abscessus subsp. abscessus]|nr:ABC transporter permease [Mycobacteroides abscessus subsp. abscessus]
MTASTLTATGAAQSAPATARRRALTARQLLQPFACVVAVMVSLAYGSGSVRPLRPSD